MIEKVDAKQIFKDYMKTIKIRKQVTQNFIDDLLQDESPTPSSQQSSSLITNKIKQLFISCNNPNDYRIEFVVFYNNKAIVTMPCFYKTIMYNIKNNIDWLQRLIDATKLSISYMEANNKEEN